MQWSYEIGVRTKSWRLITLCMIKDLFVFCYSLLSILSFCFTILMYQIGKNLRDIQACRRDHYITTRLNQPNVYLTNKYEIFSPKKILVIKCKLNQEKWNILTEKSFFTCWTKHAVLFWWLKAYIKKFIFYKKIPLPTRIKALTEYFVTYTHINMLETLTVKLKFG